MTNVSMRVFSIIVGIVLLLVAGCGVVCWVSEFEMHKTILIDGSTVSYDRGGSHVEIPGRLVVALVLVIPIVCAVGGGWLLHSEFDGEAAHHD
jgi:hypothetical protein